MSHHFKLGQAVMFVPGARDLAKTDTMGVVTRLLPKDGADYQYHIRFGVDGQQRRVHEDQLRVVAEAALKPNP